MSPKVTQTVLPEVVILEPEVFGDDRGFFFESFNNKAFREATEVTCSFVQDNHSKSSKGVVRGLHYQIRQPQGKLVRVLDGVIFDVTVDIRQGSPIGKWVGVELSAESKKQLWVPLILHTDFWSCLKSPKLYKTTDYYSPENERSIRWDDPSIGIDWPKLSISPLLSAKDRNACLLNNAELPKAHDENSRNSANGQVGSELRSALNCSTRQGRLHAHITFSDRSDLDVGHLHTISTYLDRISPDIIINATAYTAVDKAEAQRDLAFLINEAAVNELALFCQKRTSYLIHISTDYVFNGLSDRPYVESDGVGPSSVCSGSNSPVRGLFVRFLKNTLSCARLGFSSKGSNFVKTMSACFGKR